MSILDLVFVSKDDDGNVVGVELNDVDDSVSAPYIEIEGEVQGLLSDEDFEDIGALLEPGSSALAIVWEDSWARTFVRSVRAAGGVLVAHDRIDAATVGAALGEIDGIPIDNERAERGQARRTSVPTRCRAAPTPGSPAAACPSS